MPSSIPAPLAAYIADCLTPDSQTLVTSVLSTPAPWLCLRLLYAGLYGVEDSARHTEQTGHEVIFVSLLRPLSLWTEMGKKMGLDLPSLLKSRRVRYIDGLAGGTTSSTMSTGSATAESDPQQLPTTRLKSMALKDIRDALDGVLKTPSISTPSTGSSATPLSSSTSTTGSARGGALTPRIPTAAATRSFSPAAGRPTIYIDGIDFLLASQPAISTVELQSFLATLRSKCHALMLACQADSPLLHSSSTTSPDAGTPLERNHAHFITSLAHSTRWLFQLRGLDTGSANDISGVIRVSRGGDDSIEFGPNEGQDKNHVQDLVDAEWLYQLKGDGSVRVWARGE
ncbi:hypothetical protein A1O1_05757 [Capronia coronata CBS 617.96]|uniref:Elongator complex protein 5 n=1 Tax=Capronia coronata CBS 617.96 TaxID=1182541 RepID=W9XYV9_9EURO|nr:uncharacterized protein A1O1_05757 [Capronia coronata CBS 617.96]EXJ85393.1 hypothetical protein A1O1_05757 [Capronia coronata CBS 617.96]